MKYCKTCKQLCFGEALPFDGCKHKLREIEDINEPVRLCVAGGTERAMLTGMLKDANIPYIEEPVYPQGVANEIVTGYDVKLSNISIVVPFSALPKAVELLGAIETLPHDLEPHMDEITARIERLKADREEAESMRKHYHASKGYKSDDVERLMQKVKNSIGWDSLEHLRPNEKEVMLKYCQMGYIY